MKNIVLTIFLFLLIGLTTKAQEGNFSLADVESIKDRQLIVMVPDDMKYPAYVQASQRFSKVINERWKWHDTRVYKTETEVYDIIKKKKPGYAILCYRIVENIVDSNTQLGIKTITTNSTSRIDLLLPDRNVLYLFRLPKLYPSEAEIVTAVLDCQNYLAETIELKYQPSYYSRMNTNAHLMQTKILLVSEDDIDKKVTESEIKAKYPYQYQIASKDMIEQAILFKDPQYVFVQMIRYDFGSSVAHNNYIYDCETGKLVVFTMSKPDRIGSKQFASYTKVINKITAAR